MTRAINCNPTIIKKFTSEFLKEKRKIKLINQNNRLMIRRYGDGITDVKDEVKIIKWLQNKLPDIKIPAILNYKNDYIDFEYIEGIRCFNFLIAMKELYLESKHKAKAFHLSHKILTILNHHLQLFQGTADEVKKIFKVQNYPYVTKALNALDLLSTILGISKLDGEIIDDIKSLSKLINGICDVPFKDSTPKNAIIHFPQLSIRHFSSEYDRNQNIMTFLFHEGIDVDIFANHIYHIDYSGFPFFCPQFDDWICLNLHESTKWLLPNINMNKNNEVFLSTAIFRFIRLGARKLAYQLLHKDAAYIRYKYENALYYFNKIEMWISKLVEMGVIKGNKWLELNVLLMKACSLNPDIDFFDYYNEISTCRYYADVYPY